MSLYNLLDSIKVSLPKLPEVDTESEFNIIFKKLKKNNLDNINNINPVKMANLASSFETLSLSQFETATVKSDFNPDLFVTPVNVGKIVIPNLPATVLPISPDLEKIVAVQSESAPTPITPVSVSTPITPAQIVPASSIIIQTNTQRVSNKTYVYTLEELTKKGVTKPVLQDILVRLGGKKTGNKDELINRILEIQKNVV